MRGWKGILAGVIGLAALQAVVSTQASAQRAGGILTGLAGMVQKFMDPTVPAFGPAQTNSSASSSGTQVTTMAYVYPTTTSAVPPATSGVPRAPTTPTGTVGGQPTYV